MLEVSIVQTYILQLKLITMQLFSIAILFQLYKLYILQLKLRQRLEHCTFIRRFNCTNLHPSTETNEQETANKNRICFNCTNLHPSN